jgi:hypothetical protein
MLIRKAASLAVMAAIGLVAFSATSASASTALRTDPGNVRLTGLTQIANTSSDTLTWDIPTVSHRSCAQTSFNARLNANTSSSSITGTLTSFTMPCVGMTCILSPTSPFPVIHISANTDQGANFTIDDMTLRCPATDAFGTHGFCYHTASTVTGSYLNVISRLVFPFVTLVHTTGPGDLGIGVCSSFASSLSVTLTHFVQTGTNKTLTVTTT